MHAIDNGLTDGWYSYQVNGIDIFGRHSTNSAPAEWYQWAPMPDPRPWYYQVPPADRVIHSFAVALLKKQPPPAPTRVEAYALDPRDPTVLKDACLPCVACDSDFGRADHAYRAASELVVDACSICARHPTLANFASTSIRGS